MSNTAIPSALHPCSICSDISGHAAYELLRPAPAGSRSRAQLIHEFLLTVGVTTTSLADEYFATVHHGMPIVEESKFRSQMASWPQVRDCHTDTLILAIFLITRIPCSCDDHLVSSNIYWVARQMFLSQASESPTLELLQAGLLISYFSCGHGMLKDANITVSTCVTVGKLMSLDLTDTYDLAGPDRRFSTCRWAIILIDRYAFVKQLRFHTHLIDRIIALASFQIPLPLAAPLCGSPVPDSLDIISRFAGPERRFEAASVIALLIGTALDYASKIKSCKVPQPTYSDICGYLQQLVNDLISITTTETDGHTFCLSTSLAVT